MKRTKPATVQVATSLPLVRWLSYNDNNNVPPLDERNSNCICVSCHVNSFAGEAVATVPLPLGKKAEL